MLNGKIIQTVFIQMNIIFGKEREKYFTHIMLKQINESLLNMVTHTMNASLVLKVTLEKMVLTDSLEFILKKLNNDIFCGQLMQQRQTSLQNQAVIKSLSQMILKIQLHLKNGCQHLQKLLMDMLSELVRNQFLVMTRLKIDILSIQTQLKIMPML